VVVFPGSNCDHDTYNVIAEVARQHDLMPQHLSNWIRAAKDGHFALQADDVPAFVPVVSVEPERRRRPAGRERTASIEITIGSVRVKVPGGVDARAIEAVLRAVKRVSA